MIVSAKGPASSNIKVLPTGLRTQRARARETIRDQSFDLAEGCFEIPIGLGQQIFDPGGRPADKIGAKQGELFLQLHADGRADQMTFQSKDPFLFFDAGFNGLAGVIALKPVQQGWGRGISIIQQGGGAV